MAPSTCFSIPLHFFLLLLFFVVVHSEVPQSKTFQFINEGQFNEYIVEYDPNHRIVSGLDSSFYSTPFRLCFYNTTPDAHIFAIRAGLSRDEDLMRWVWDANRNNPVRENSTLTFGRDGNLVVRDVDGRIAWQTNTANKGVTGISLLPNANLVLHDKNGRIIWQSFDYPTDTLLVGQSLRMTGRNKLVSRTSDAIGRDGPYSIVVDKKGFTMYVNNSGQLLRYGGWRSETGTLNVTFDAVPEDQSITAYELVLAFTELPQPNSPPSRHLLQSRPAGNSRGLILKKLNYNATYSFFRLGSDGNIRTFTYYRNTSYLKWAETYSFFGDDVRECRLPSKCGSFGFCDNAMCVACPSPKGLLGWSESCKPPQLTGCKTGGTAANYYKIAGVEHFMSLYNEGEGPIKVNDCRDKCSKDCKCVGFFYNEETSKCLRVPLLGTLIKHVNASHVGFIKY